MKSKILVDYETYMCSVALLEDGDLREFYVEDYNMERMTGDIYKGKVVKVLPGLASAFVDIGKRKNGYLAASDMLEDRTTLARSGRLPTTLNVAEGDYVLVQVVKEPNETKGPRLSANLSIPGRYVVYMPTVDFIGVSNKITDEAVRGKLNDLLVWARPAPGCGLIARTAAKDASPTDIVNEINYFASTYAQLIAKFNSTDGVARLSTDGDLIFRCVRDMLNSSVDEVVCNSAPIASRLDKYLSERLASSVKVTALADEDVLKKYGVLDDVEKLLRSKVRLESGGNLVIDYTEALTVIDVNTAKFIGDTDRENTVFQINCEAAREIARQLRLRNVGGMVVIDFIDMTDPAHNEEVVEILRREAALDRMRTRVLPMTELGLVQMTRKKSGVELQSLLLQRCRECNGTAHTVSPNFLMRRIKAQLTEIFNDANCASAVVSVSNTIYNQLKNGEWRLYLGKYDDRRVFAVASSEVGANSFRISARSSAEMPENAYVLN